MAGHADEPVLFEAVSTPPRSFAPRAYLVLCLLLGLAASATGVLFLWLGAWPVFGFLGAEVALVLALVLVQARWSRGAVELVILTPGRLTVSSSDGRARRRQAELPPYWARVELTERGEAATLAVAARGRRVEIGRYLNAAEKRELAAALGEALRRLREPVFDNPQLREAGGASGQAGDSTDAKPGQSAG